MIARVRTPSRERVLKRTERPAFVGLSAEQARRRLAEVGLNAIEERKPPAWRKVALWLVSPISLMLAAAAVLSAVSGKDFDAGFIVFLMVMNFGISFWQERKADHALEALRAQLSVRSRVLRDGAWAWVPSEQLVPGDILELSSGDLVPADARVLSSDNLSVNQASVTGESLPVDAPVGRLVYSGSSAVTGRGVARVEATGSRTSFGKTLVSVDASPKRSVLENDILLLTRSLLVVSVAGVAVLVFFSLLRHAPLSDVAELALSLAIAGIPISLPTVMTLITSLGILELSKKKLVVRRLSALEDFANVDVLFTDKTGTLTLNHVAAERVLPFGSNGPGDVALLGFVGTKGDSRSVLSAALSELAVRSRVASRAHRVVSFIPADSLTKRTRAVVALGARRLDVTVGAPQVVRALCRLAPKDAARFEREIESAARGGFRVLAVASKPAGSTSPMGLAGLVLLSDPLRPDAKTTLAFLRDNGVSVEMLTGDHAQIARRVGVDLGLPASAVHAQILPADKLRLVRDAQSSHVVAVTGDGMNDLPALKAANVGIAVSNAVDALKSAADIVLLSPGLTVITDGILEARRIFARIYSYSMYRLSESLRLIVSIVILGIGYGSFPLSPLQLIVLALLNDVPIISLAFNRVQLAHKPAKINVKERFLESALFGMVGVLNSLLFFVLLTDVFHADWLVIGTAFFLKLTVSGHMLLFVAHTEDRWWRYLPSAPVIAATLSTQLIATALAVAGVFMQAIPLWLAAFVWVWALGWMQVSELMKDVKRALLTPSIAVKRPPTLPY